MKLLHLADVHLDAPFRWLGGRGRAQRAQVKEAFRAAVELALRESVDAFLVAGDLFDSNSPSEDTVDLVRAQLGRLRAPVFLLPGTHDCLDETSIYRRADFTTPGGPPIHVFDPARTAVEVRSLDLTVHARANTTKTSTVSPLEGLARNPGTRYNVALAHGSLLRPGTADDFPLTPEQIAGAGMDYVALGHWHRCQDCSVGRARAYYSGPPELLAAGERGSALLVELTPDGARIAERTVGRRRFARLSLSLDALAGAEAVRERIRALGDPDLVLDVVLSGLRPLGLVLDADELADELGGAFFALRVEDQSHPTLSEEEIAGLSERQVLGQFVRRMRARIAAAPSPDERRVCEEALQLGVALLQGKRVLQ